MKRLHVGGVAMGIVRAGIAGNATSLPAYRTLIAHVRSAPLDIISGISERTDRTGILARFLET